MRQSLSIRCACQSAIVFCTVLIMATSASAQVSPPNPPCDNVSGATATCTGDVSSGVSASTPFTTLNVNTLTQAITPASGVPGIHLESSSGSSANITLNADTTGTAGITTSNAPGVSAFTRMVLSSFFETHTLTNFIGGGITVSSVGDITTSDRAGIGTFTQYSIGGFNDTNNITNAISGNTAITSTSTISTSGTFADGIGVGSSFNFAGVGDTHTVENAIAGEVAVNNAGEITTSGALSNGVSISSRMTFGNSNGTTTLTNATMGAVTVNNTGNITTSGFLSHGITVTAGIFVSGATTITNRSFGDVTINSDSIIAATGDHSTGINIGASSPGGNIDINILGGSVTGGSLTGVGVRIAGGENNTLDNYGSISALSGLAVSGGTQHETITNFGTITGNIELGTGTNAIFNMSGGVLNPGSTVDVGAGNLLTNSGVLSTGGANTIQTTALTGNFEQTATGVFAVDVGADTSDLLNGSGTATVAGTVVVLPTNVGPGSTTVTILTASGGVTDNGLALGPISLALQAQLLILANRVDLSFDVNFAVAGLNANQTAIAANINAMGAGAPGGVTNGLLNVAGIGAYANALDQLSPEIYNLSAIETLYASQQFASDMLSCRVAGEDGYAAIHEGQCLWIRGRGRFLDLDRTASNIGADATTGSFSTGVQVALAPDWRLGLAAGYDNISLDTTSGASAEGDRANIGAMIKYNPGPLLLAAGITGGWGSFDTTRVMSFGGFSGITTADNDIDYISGRLHAAYLIEQGNWYLKPMVDAGVVDLDVDGFTERGGAGAALRVAGQSSTVYFISPAIELGTDMRFDDISVWRPFVRAGVTWQSDDSLPLTAGFAAAPGTSPFTINSEIDDVLADIAAGVDIINVDGTVFRMQYDGRFGSNTTQSGVSIKGSVKF